MKETKDIVIGRTRSICPVCGRQLPAQRVRHGEDIFLEKSCPEHGDFSTVIWSCLLYTSSSGCRSNAQGYEETGRHLPHL